MIIAVNKCPQNITLKAFNLSHQIYIYYLCFNIPEIYDPKSLQKTVGSKTVIEQNRKYSRKWMGMEMGLYVPIVSQDRGDIMAEYIINAISIN